VSNKTKNKIPSIVSRQNITHDTRLILTNAIYFKGKWAKQFRKSSTIKNHTFYSPGKKVKVPMMYQERKFNYTETADCQILELLYQGHEMRMIILLPKDKNGLSKIEQQLSVENLSSWLSKIHQQKVKLYLPKFKMALETELSKTLNKMGMVEAFDQYSADFSGITNDPLGLCISDVIHKAVVEIDEEGTEAAAATAVHFRRVMSAHTPKDPIIFRADHPFIFLIQASNGNILFMGRVTNPEAELS
jgi:serpin B